MSTIANRLHSLQSQFSRFLSRRRDLKLLLQLDDRTLTDINVSRALLEDGVKAWPWRIDGNEAPVRVTAERIRSAVNELEHYSDAELADLGITRGTILEAVLKGRPGIEASVNDNVYPKAA